MRSSARERERERERVREREAWGRKERLCGTIPFTMFIGLPR
jgi:hypothetical protein